MDDPPSEGNERIADIFIASTDGTVAALLTEQMEKNNHRVTVFTDDTQLSDTLLTRKPDLLICDGTIGAMERFEVIRRIKADKDLWSIPVLALTAASTMDDLLQVLESNADNFIAPPFDSPDHLSLIEGMLTSPLEPPTPDDTRKQFKVRQDERTYVIVAPRRKLLEYLLSSFESVVTTSSGLSCANSKILELSESARDLEQKVAGQTKDIEALNTTSLKNEQKIIDLTRECEELKKSFSQKTEEIKNLAAEYDTKKTSLDTLENALMDEEARNASLEKKLRELTSELEQQKSALEAEKKRSLSAEQEINMLKEAKTQSENELNQVISGLNETVQQHAAGQTRLQREITEEINRRVLAENQAGERQREFEQSRNTNQSELDALTSQEGKLREELAASTAALETEQGLRRAAEEKTQAAVRQQEDLGKKARITEEEMQRTNRDQTAIISQIKEELKIAVHQVQSLEADLNNLSREKSHAAQEVRTLTAELEQTRSTLADERKSHLETDEANASAGKERHLVQQPLISPDEVTGPKEELELVVPDEPHLPMTVPPVSQPVTREKSPGSQNLPVSNRDLVSVESSGKTPRVFSGLIPQVSGISGADSLFLESEPVEKNLGPAPGPAKVKESLEEKTIRGSVPEEPTMKDDQTVQPFSDTREKPEQEAAGKIGLPGSEDGPGKKPGGTPEVSGGTVPGEEISFSSTQWLDLLKWAHHSDALTKDQRLKIVRMGRLIQKDRKLTKKQQEQVSEILSSASALGYHIP
ncbi:MAG: response regulator [Methanomicrobiales archaeon]